jgi:RNA polymerase nonessential primary-like sigma factor
MMEPMTDFIPDDLEALTDVDTSPTATGDVESVGGRRGSVTPDMVRTYLQEIGRVPLLTHEQEILFGKQVQQMMQLLELRDKIAAETGQPPDMAVWAERAGMTVAALEETLRRGQRAKQRMIEANLRLVVSIAKKYQKRNLELLDLIQEGTLGLERGVEKFDPTRGYKFSTYAYWWIRQAITRAIAQQARTIRLPIHITEKLNKIKKTQRELSQQLGRSATPSEIAQALELEPAQIREYLLMSRQPISMDLRIGDNQDTELGELLEDRGLSPEDFTTGGAARGPGAVDGGTDAPTAGSHQPALWLARWEGTVFVQGGQTVEPVAGAGAAVGAAGSGTPTPPSGEYSGIPGELGGAQRRWGTMIYPSCSFPST